MEKSKNTMAIEGIKKDNILLCRNIKKMISLLIDDKQASGKHYTKSQACADLQITATSLSRWEKSPDRLINIRSLRPLYQKYREYFVPQLSKAEDLIEKDITEELHLINAVGHIDLLKLFCNSYYVYYYSDHSPEEIHFGRLRLFTEGNNVSAKLVIGIPTLNGVNDNALNKVFEKDSNSFEEFNAYRKKLKRIDERYCYYYYGSAAISGSMLVLTLFGRDRNNNENDHKLIIYINIKRIISRQAEESDRRPYFGGMSMAISMPNSKHTSLRIFRIGISKWKIPPRGLEMLSSMLRHSQGIHQRIVMSEDDDRNWFHGIAKYQD